MDLNFNVFRKNLKNTEEEEKKDLNKFIISVQSENLINIEEEKILNNRLLIILITLLN